MTDDIRTIEYEIGGEDFRSGMSKGRRLTTEPVDDSDDVQKWTDLMHSVIRKHGDPSFALSRKEEYGGDAEGDRITLGEIIDRRGVTVDDLRTQKKVSEVDILADLAVGDVLTLTNHNGDRTGVVRKLKDGDNQGPVSFPPRAEILWDDGWCWSVLEKEDNELRLGRAGMMSEVYDLTAEDPATVSDDIQDIRERVLESDRLDQRIDESDLEVVDSKSWERGRDLIGKLTVTGGPIDDTVTVTCRNVFDAGWVASVEADVDENTSELLTRFARHNSPVSTGVRM